MMSQEPRPRNRKAADRFASAGGVFVCSRTKNDHDVTHDE